MILSPRGAVEFMNSELRGVLGVADARQVEQGLHLKLFKRYQGTDTPQRKGPSSSTENSDTLPAKSLQSIIEEEELEP